MRFPVSENSPLFSVVIPVYQREDKIGVTLRSVAAQSFRDFETFVVDDGSRDETCAVVEKFDFVSLIRQSNAGPGSARNRGVAAASGKYIAFLDSDDLWFPWTLQRYAETITHHNNPSFVTGFPLCFTSEDELRKVADAHPAFRSFRDYLSTRDEWLWYGVSSFVVRRDVLLSVGGFIDGRVNGEDAELAMRLGTANGFVHISNPPMFGYRIHDGNVTLDREKSQKGLQLLIQGERDGRFPGGHARALDRSVVISRHIRPFAVESARRGDSSIALTLYLSVIRETLVNWRWKFVLGLPLLVLWGIIKRLMRLSQS